MQTPGVSLDLGGKNIRIHMTSGTVTAIVHLTPVQAQFLSESLASHVKLVQGEEELGQ